MTLFSKAKNETAPVPESCAQCGARGGTVQLHFVVAPDDDTQSPVPRPIWLCPACQAAAHRGGHAN